MVSRCCLFHGEDGPRKSSPAHWVFGCICCDVVFVE